MFDASAANYRSIAVGAFQQVEDSLAMLNHYHDAAVDEKAAVDAAQRTLDFSMALYVQGATDYSHRRPRKAPSSSSMDMTAAQRPNFVWACFVSSARTS